MPGQDFLVRVDPNTAADWISKGEAVIIDIRELDEYDREKIPNTQLMPFSHFNPKAISPLENKKPIFMCAAGGRSQKAANMLHENGWGEVYHLEGGIRAWSSAGLETIKSSATSIPLMQQVRIVAGSLVLAGCVLGYLSNPAWYGLSAFVGAGLFYSGVSGSCMMANILGKMPWNKL